MTKNNMVEAVNEVKKAIFSMGLPASGKTTTLARVFDTTGFVVIDPDEIKKEKNDYDPKNPAVYHEWSKQQANIRMAQGISENRDLIIDGTGTNVEKMYKQITELQAVGYDVTVFYCKVKLSTAIERNNKRERTVPIEIIKEKFETISYAFEILSGIADHVRVANND